MAIQRAHAPLKDISLFDEEPVIEPKAQSFEPQPFFATGSPVPFHTTALGALYSGDCQAILAQMRDGSVDCVFADPPFNIGKEYRNGTDDKRPDDQYVAWCYSWLDECYRILKPGGALFVYNMPRWNILLGAYLMQRHCMELRHWIAIEMSACLPIPKRLHPSHYSLIYYTKGSPKVFRRIRTPIQLCRHCGGEIKDYGGHRGAMNPNGVTLKDVWTDIPPVRHWKFKSRNRNANALSTKVLERVVEMSTAPGDIIVDPFGGSGTTFAVCEERHRHWIGMEIDYADDIVSRLENGHIQPHTNTDFVEE